ncbi:MAG: hypothetical protein A2X86_15545 [Bdellovibrionales bacterium GWA2_49_15]|nr:MAG: hypothetical protein A2X86_15545 [Bdellovibrionales bacterium GWA2_49_15]HAZ14544.1 hypothetical protein [Bdellovibrionales bacterium]
MRDIILILFLFLAAGKAFAGLELAALVHEQYRSQGDMGYGSQGGMILARQANDAGFKSFTMSIRMATQGTTSDLVYLPVNRTPIADIERFIVRSSHSFSKVTMRPIMTADIGLMMSNLLQEYNPANPGRWAEYYYQSIFPYVALADEYDIDEFVVAVGLAKLWNSKNSDLWLTLVKKIARRINGIKLSLEITSENDLSALEHWRSEDPVKFEQFLSYFKTLRFSVNDQLPLKLADWQKDPISKVLKNNFARLRTAYPDKDLKLVNLTVPACEQFNYKKSAFTCEGGPWNFASQTKAAKQFFLALNELEEDALENLIQVEVNVGVTQFEPAFEFRDPRLFYYSPDFDKLFLQELKDGEVWKETIQEKKTLIETPDPNLALACIYFNARKGDIVIGEIHATLLMNLMGGFPKWRVEDRDVEKYKASDLASCRVSFYIATDYFYQPNEAFLTDAVHFSQNKTFVWFNYQFNHFEKKYLEVAEKEKLSPLEFSFKMIHKPDSEPTPTNLQVGFYRDFEYKGQVFNKLEKWNFNTKSYMASPELAIVSLSAAHPNTTVLSLARHSKDNSVTPYISQQKFGRSGNLFFFGDTPFSFIHYEDRYLIFTDVLWDILGETPSTEKRALVRLEDVGGNSSAANLRRVVDYLADSHTPFSIATIPYYSNVYGTSTDSGGVEPLYKPLTLIPEINGILRYAKARGANFIFHGVSHQGGDHICGYDGISGADFEFWMYPENTPMPEDSVSWVTGLLDAGEQAFKGLGIVPDAWETPHYANSALDSIIFGRTFSWTYHRPIYFPINSITIPKRQKELHYFACKGELCKQKRHEYLRGIKVDLMTTQFSGQIFPYPIYKDVYGQRIIPETLGMVDHLDYEPPTWRSISSDQDILRIAKKLTVIRGAIASFFWHPHILSPGTTYRYMEDPTLYYRMDEGLKYLSNVIEGLKDMGYTFVSIGDPKIFPKD